MKSMCPRSFRVFATAAFLLFSAYKTCAVSLVLNPSFEQSYNPTFPHYGAIAGWSGGSGTNQNTGPFHNSGTPIPAGAQVAFHQDDNQSLSQTITNLVPGESYWLQFYYDTRNCCGGSSVDLAINVGGMVVDQVPGVLPSTNGAPYKFRNVPFTPQGSSTDIAFQSTSNGDATLVYDAVSIIKRGPNDLVLANPSFEASGTPAGTGHLSGIVGWNATGSVGINASGSGPFADNGTPPDQDRVAFLEGAANLTQPVRGLAPGTDYDLVFARNARSGDAAHLQATLDGAIVWESDLTAVGGANPYVIETIPFTAASTNMVIGFNQTAAGAVVLLDDVRVSGTVVPPLPCLALTPAVTYLRPGERATVFATVETAALAGTGRSIVVRSPDPAILSIVGADVTGQLVLEFLEDAPTTTLSFEIEGVASGTAPLEIIDPADLCVEATVTASVSDSIVLNPSFEITPPPGDPGYGDIPAWSNVPASSGVNGGAGPFHDNGILPDRAHVAFLQGTQTISQNLGPLVAGQNYWLQFHYNARNCCGGTLGLSVTYDGNEIFSASDVAPVGVGAPYHFANAAFSPEIPSGTLAFNVTASGDASLLLDAITLVARAANEVIVRNPSFEASLPPTGVGYIGPDAIAGWTATGGWGVNLDRTGPFTDNGDAPEQLGVAFLQGDGSLEQTVTGFNPGQPYALAIAMNTRDCCPPGSVGTHFRVLFDGGLLVEDDLTPVGGGNPYRTVETLITPNSDNGLLRIEHLPPVGSDYTLLLDQVRITPGGSLIPILSISIVAGNTARLAWPAPFAQWELQESTTLEEASWRNVSAPPNIVGNEVVVADVLTTPIKNYRLVLREAP
jgi:hypothetical protein